MWKVFGIPLIVIIEIKFQNFVKKMQKETKIN